MKALFRRLPIATSLFLLHSALFLLLIGFISADPEGRGMLLFFAYYADWPSSLLAVGLLEMSEPLVGATHFGAYSAVLYLLCSGLQWAFIGCILDVNRDELFPKARSAANPSV